MQKSPTAGIVLAAGESKRFGRPKQLLKIQDRHLVEWVLDAALGSRLARVILVLGFKHQKILQSLAKQVSHPRLQVVINDHYHQGQSRSLRFGLSAVKDNFPSTMFLLGDQPLVTAEFIDDLLRHFWSSTEIICVPIHQGTRGNPTIFSKTFYPQILQLQGDIGARGIIESHPNDVLQVEIGDPRYFFDIDRPEELASLESFLCT
jgi:molybdenum cofactor cytidylyltransferase